MPSKLYEIRKRELTPSELRMIDVLDPELAVELIVSEDGHRLWINVDGQNVLRVQWMNNKPSIELQDPANHLSKEG